MRVMFSLSLALALAGTGGVAWAQASPLETRMGSAQFRAAGLHKLDEAELQSLERWMDTQAAGHGPAQAQLEEARAAGRREASQLRGAPQVAPEPVSSTLAGRFEGFRRGREYTLANGQVWRQIGDNAMEGVRAEAPAVEIQPSRLGGWWMRVAGYNLRVRVERIR